MFVVWAVGSDLNDGLIAPSETFYRVRGWFTR